MTTDITELTQRMKTAAEKATQGEWWADEVKNEGCYGSGDDCVEGFTSYAIYGSDGQTLFDSLNSDAACICEEYDGEGHVAWDETAQRNAEFIALANPANVLALVEALEKVQSRDVTQAAKDYHFDQQADRIAELDAELEREREKTRRVMSRIAELESRTVKLPGERFCPAEYAGSQLWSETEVWNKAITACADALRADGIKVEAE